MIMNCSDHEHDDYDSHDHDGQTQQDGEHHDPDRSVVVEHRLPRCCCIQHVVAHPLVVKPILLQVSILIFERAI